MEYMIDAYNTKSDKINFEDSIFNQKEVQGELKKNVISEGFLSESAQSNILKTNIKNQNKFKLRENYIKNAMSKILTQVLFESFYSSIYIDESFKSNYKKSLFNELNEAIDSLNPDIFDTYKQLREKSEFLSEVCGFCLETVRKKEKEKCEEEQFPNEFELDEELIHDIDDYIENNDDLTDLSKLVKEKVMDTITMEKEKSEKEKSLMDDVVAESIILIKNPDKVQEEYTLFKSFVINSYKKALKENVDEYFSTAENGERKANMDLILAEAVVKYTLHEFFYTANIKEYTATDMKQLCENLVYDL